MNRKIWPSEEIRNWSFLPLDSISITVSSTYIPVPFLLRGIRFNHRINAIKEMEETLLGNTDRTVCIRSTGHSAIIHPLTTMIQSMMP